MADYKNAAALFIGGAAGAVSRFKLDAAITQSLALAFPVGILFVNVLGGFLMGLLQGFMKRRGKPFRLGYSLLGTGFLGGFTTFSHFALNTFDLYRGGAVYLAAANILLSVVLCVCAVWVGYRLVAPRPAPDSHAG